MKRKDWITLIAMLLILGVALIGEQFISMGNWMDALINLSLKVLPWALFFVLAVLARKRKGNYMNTYRKGSYVLFAISLVCLLCFISKPFMHYFNVMGSQKKVKQSTETILAQCQDMFSDYEKQVGSRVNAYSENVKSAYEGNREKMNVLIEKDKSATSYRNWPDEWQVKMFKNHSANKKQFDGQKTKFNNALVMNFNPFLAASQFDQLAMQYKNYYKLLSEDFANLTPFEEHDGAERVFEASEIDTVCQETQAIFGKPGFNGAFFLVFLLLSFFSTASYVFIKEDSVRKPSRRNADLSIYDQGFKL